MHVLRASCLSLSVQVSMDTGMRVGDMMQPGFLSMFVEAEGRKRLEEAM